MHIQEIWPNRYFVLVINRDSNQSCTVSSFYIYMDQCTYAKKYNFERFFCRRGCRTDEKYLDPAFLKTFWRNLTELSPTIFAIYTCCFSSHLCFSGDPIGPLRRKRTWWAWGCGKEEESWSWVAVSKRIVIVGSQALRWWLTVKND